MARKKSPKPAQLLSRLLAIRLTEQEYKRLENIRHQSDCHSIGEVIRRILAKRQIKLFYKDITMEGVVEELAAIRSELRAIGININQITRHFNGTSHEGKRVILAHQTLEHYRKVETKIKLLLSLISQLSRKW